VVIAEQPGSHQSAAKGRSDVTTDHGGFRPAGRSFPGWIDLGQRVQRTERSSDRFGPGTKLSLELVSCPDTVGKFGPGRDRTRQGPATPAQGRGGGQDLGVLDALDHDREGTSNVPREDGRMLRLLAEATGARNVVELGTSNGYSGLWFSLALSKTGGHLTTFDIDKGRFEMARDNFRKAGVDGLVAQVLGDAHKEVARLKDPIDLLFIDADKQGYLDYFTKLLPLVRPGGLIVAHNMASPPPDPAFVKAITTNPELETLLVNMESMGLGITLKKR